MLTAVFFCAAKISHNPTTQLHFSAANAIMDIHRKKEECNVSTLKRFICALLAAVLLVGAAPLVNVRAVNAASAEVACVIDPSNTGKVSVSAQVTSNVKSDDARLYLFAVPTYVDSLSGQAPVTSTKFSGAGTYGFSVDLNNNTASSLLYSKFYVAVKSGGAYSALHTGSFITNPEAVAASKAARTEPASKKGIHMTLSIPTDLEELGIKHGYFNICLEDFISNTATDCAYSYNGKTYYFKPVIGDYDNLIGNMTRAGIAVTVTLLNEYVAGYEYLLHPGVSPRDGTTNYAINTSTQQGLETVAAATHFLAERYNGSSASFGKVDNWIVGNEVNDNLLYYYMGPQNADTFVQEYLQTFRVMYTAVKSAYSNANVYICLQHRWNTEDSTGDYGGKSFIDKFSSYAKAQGDIDWGLSYHPYSFPMNDADILNDGEPSVDQNGNGVYGGEVTNDITTPLITMKNISILTDYFHNAALLNPAGQVRSIILGEQGYTSYSNITGQNEAKQAANIALAYYIAEMNEDVDAFLLRCLSDENEGSPYFKFGLRNAAANGTPSTAKYAYEMYKYIDTAESLQYTDFAKAAFNISNWSNVVKGWNANAFKSMGTRTENQLYTVTGSTKTSVVVDKMLDQWETGYNVFDIGQFDYEPVHYPNGVAVANSFAYYMDYQGIEKHFATPANLSGSGYLTFDVNFKPMDASGSADRLELKVRLCSGDDVYDATGIVSVNKDYTVCLDLSKWSGRSAIDTMEVLIREYGKEKSFAGTFTVYNVTAASSVSGMQALESVSQARTDLSAASLSYQKSFNYTGSAISPAVTVKLNGKTLVQHQDYDIIYNNNVKSGQAQLAVVGIGAYTGYTTGNFTIQSDYPTVYNGVDYSAVYAYGYYRDNNPAVVKEVGDDPQALLEHFVTKGMQYALQGIGDFNVLAYAKMNSDLAPEFGENWPAYYMHYLEHGLAEGRSASGIKPDDMQAPVYPGSTTPDTPSDTPSGGEPTTGETTPMYRLYNPNSGEHFYTGSIQERDNLVNAGWAYEGIAWNAPITTGTPVYRVFNPNSGDHHYTMSKEEVDMLVGLGWQYEGVCWNSASAENLPLYRLYNPNADCGSHHYTGSTEERDNLVNVGWIYEGIGWFGMLR